jgi:plastocyanin
MRKIPGLFGVLVLALAAVSCGGGGDGGVSPPPPPPPPPPTCPANTFCLSAALSFSPTARTVAGGTTVTWQNSSSVLHNVTWDNAAGRNAALAGNGTGDIPDFSNASHTRLFNALGTYGFHCTIHPGMNGTLTVQ